MPLFFKKIAANPVLHEKLQTAALTESLISFINSYGNEPAKAQTLQSHPGLLLETVLGQKKTPWIKAFLQNETINNRHQFITVGVYLKILATQDIGLISACNKVLKTCSSQKHKALVLYPVVTKVLEQALNQDAGLYKKVMKAWENINLDELLALNLFLQLASDSQDIVHYLKGGLFAVQDGGKLKQFFQENMAAKDRSRDCSHLSITPVHSTQGKFIPEFLFGDRNIAFDGARQIYSRDNKTDDSYSWFQTEYASIFGESKWEAIKNSIVHKICFVIYWLTNKNIGPYGLSAYKEKNIRILNKLSNMASNEAYSAVTDAEGPSFAKLSS